MASVSDAEDGWASLEELLGSFDDESVKQGSEHPTPEFQSKVDALQEKTDLLQLQVKLEEDSIKALTDRVKFFETFDRHTQEICVNSTQAVGFLQTDVSSLKKAMKNVETQSRDCKSSTDGLADRVNCIEVKAKCLEDETIKRLEEQTYCVNALETHLEDLIDETDECVDWAMDEMADLRSNVNRLEKDIKDRIDSEKSTSNDQSSIDAIQRDVKSLQSQVKDYDPSMYFLANSLKDMEDKTKRLEGEINERFEGQTDRMSALENHLERRAEVNSERVDRAITEVHSRLDDARIDKKDLQSQIRLIKGFIRSLVKRVDALETSAARENSERLYERLGQEHKFITAVHDSVQGLEEDTKHRFEGATNRVKALEEKVECLQQEAKDCADCGIAVAEGQSRVDAIQWEAENVQSQIELNEVSIKSLINRVNTLETNVEQVGQESCEHLGRGSDVNTYCDRLEQELSERFEQDICRVESQLQDFVTNKCKRIKEEMDHREALDTDVKRLDKERMDNLERQNHALHDDLSKAERIIIELYNGIQGALGLTETDISGLKQRVEMLESAARNTDSAYTTITSTKNRLRYLEARVDGLQDNSYADPNIYYRGFNPYVTGYGGFVPSYMNGPVRR